jgi:hypothetical protein
VSLFQVLFNQLVHSKDLREEIGVFDHHTCPHVDNRVQDGAWNEHEEAVVLELTVLFE